MKIKIFFILFFLIFSKELNTIEIKFPSFLKKKKKKLYRTRFSEHFFIGNAKSTTSIMAQNTWKFYAELDFPKIEFQKMDISLDSFKRNTFCYIVLKLRVFTYFSHQYAYKIRSWKWILLLFDSQFSWKPNSGYFGNFIFKWIYFVILKIFGIWKCIYIWENWRTKLKIEPKYRD